MHESTGEIKIESTHWSTFKYKQSLDFDRFQSSGYNQEVPDDTESGRKTLYYITTNDCWSWDEVINEHEW